MVTCPDCEKTVSSLWDVSELNTEFEEVCFTCKHDIQSELAHEEDEQQTMQGLCSWSCL